MKFKDVKSTENGLEFNVEASNQEITYLVGWAVERLLQEGILSINSYQSTQEVELRETSH